jgi:hypothetical protein
MELKYEAKGDNSIAYPPLLLPNYSFVANFISQHPMLLMIMTLSSSGVSRIILVGVPRLKISCCA